MTPTPTGYVKFVRGTSSAWDKLKHKDPDSLYFISEKDEDFGTLYLGEKLISGSGGEGSGAKALSELQDIKVNTAITHNSILVFDKAENKWIDKPVSLLFKDAVGIMKGATATDDGASGLVPIPKAGQENYFLRADGSWASAVGLLSEEQIEEFSNLQATVTTLVGSDTNKSVREISTDVLSNVFSQEKIESLESIIEWMENNADDTNLITLTNKVNGMDKTLNGYEETITNENGEEETKEIPGLVSVVGSLSDSLLAMSNEMTEIHNDISIMQEQLKWQEMDDILATV